MNDNFSEFILKHFGLFLYLIIINIAILCVFNYINIGDEFLKFSKPMIINVLLYTPASFLVCFLIAKKINIYIKNVFKYIVLIYFFIVALVDFVLLINFKTVFSKDIFHSFLETNFNEALEFIQTYIDFYVVFGVGFLIIFTILMARFSIKIRINYLLNIIIIAVFLIIFACYEIGLMGNNHYYSRLRNVPSNAFFKIIFLNDTKYASYKKMIESYEKIAKNYQGLKAKENIKNIILIIGESSQKDAFYNHLLTPRLNENPNKIIFTDTIAPYSYTYKAMEVLINFANVDNINYKKHYENLDIINLFNLSNYKTFWISNQDYNNSTSAISHFASYEYYLHRQVNSHALMRIQKLDELILPILDEIKLANNNFLVLHLMGNHAKYAKRYPKEFAKFSSQDVKKNVKEEHKESIAEYYNSVFYVDFIIDEVFKRFKNDDSLIIYISDHGEILKDSKRHKIFGHGVNDGKVAQIPFVFLYSDIFKEKHSDLLNRLEMAKDLPFMSDDLAHLLCDIAGIEIDVYEPSRSPINEKYNKFRIRMFANEVDYDKVLKND